MINHEKYRIAVLGTGHIGKTLARSLASAGHSVKVANSRGPETIAPDVLATGAEAADAASAMQDAQVVILSIPMAKLVDIASLVRKLSWDVIVADTSNYYPHRDDNIDTFSDGQVESLWVAQLLNRPLVKAWNAIGSDSLANKGTTEGAVGRISIPVAGNIEEHKKVVMRLVSETGVDAFDAGTLEESWRQQPGAPCYCTDLTYAEMKSALALTEQSRLPARRDIAVQAIQERMGDKRSNPTADYIVRLHRALFM
ncbi:NAD(P)-binding domain-containing protein [Rosenbergiella epipactidis]|uniref:NADPH-dependent F420 reductase n=1 Tax=Rosenbergiella epipactidis TaxID=1544694 RepID=UPI001BDB16F4|nr:NAD(P)-binding domain-containing protein [Rosenbergiella epipactidis]MBT0718602.1 NAD(P)-binding domain-containing protein [Rosenbergiella epipactidis]